MSEAPLQEMGFGGGVSGLRVGVPGFESWGRWDQDCTSRGDQHRPQPPPTNNDAAQHTRWILQGYLAHEKPPPPRTLQ